MNAIRNKITYLAGTFLALGTFFVPAIAMAAPAVTFSVSPNTGSYTTGSTFTVSIYENSGSNDVDSVRADLAYSTSTLQLLDVSNAGSPFGTCVTSAGGGSGSLTTGDCTSLGAKKQGSQKIGQATFKVLASGTASVSFNASSQAINAGEDLAESFVNASFTLNAPTPAPSNNGGGSSNGSSSTGSNNQTSTKKSSNTTTPSSSQNTATTTESPEVKGESTEKKDDKKKDEAKKDDSKDTNSNTLSRVFLLAILAVLAFVAGRYAARYMAARNKGATRATKTADEAVEAAVATGATTKKSANKSKKSSPKKNR